MIEKPNLRLYSNKLHENEAAGDYFIIDLNIRIADLGSALLFVSELNGLLMKYTPTGGQSVSLSDEVLKHAPYLSDHDKPF